MDKLIQELREMVKREGYARVLRALSEERGVAAGVHAAKGDMAAYRVVALQCLDLRRMWRGVAGKGRGG